MTRDTCRYVVSTRIRTGRSIVGFPFNPNMTEEQYEKMEVMAKEAFDKMPNDLAGDYYPLTGTLCWKCLLTLSHLRVYKKYNTSF